MHDWIYSDPAFTLLSFVILINEFLPIGTPSLSSANKFCHIICEWMHRHPFTNYRLSAEQLPGRAKYPGTNLLICAMVYSLSNAEGFVRCFLHLPQLGFAFYLGVSALFFCCIRAYFSLTTNRLLLLSAFIPVSLPVHTPVSNMVFQPIPFSRQIHFHSCLYPLIIN